MSVTMPIATKFMPAILLFVKYAYIEFYKNLKTGLIADTISLTDKCGLHIRHSVCFLFYNESPNIVFLILKRQFQQCDSRHPSLMILPDHFLFQEEELRQLVQVRYQSDPALTAPIQPCHPLHRLTPSDLALCGTAPNCEQHIFK